MRTKFIFHMLLMAAVVFLASCVKEGPAGLAGLDGTNGADGADGADGQDGAVTCLACHTGTTISAAQFQYAASVHKAGTNVAYAGGLSYCADCHSSEGFIEFQTTGTVASNISSPSAINCETCHTLHTTFGYADFGLRADDPVALKFDKGATVLDLGDGSNLCLNCHQSRRAEPNITNPGEETFTITSTHYSAHYGTQGMVLQGIGLAEISGPIDYPAAGSGKHREEASCIICHMGDYVNKEGGHTWKPSLASCQECHATNDFNYGGVQFDTEAKLDELSEMLLALGVMTEDGNSVKGEFPMVVVRAYFNWKGIYKDHSYGVHNPQYVNALLVNSIEALKALKK